MFSSVLQQIHWCVRTVTIELDSSEVISLKAEASQFPPKCHPMHSSAFTTGVVWCCVLGMTPLILLGVNILDEILF